MNEYTFDAAFPPEAGQAEVYQSTAKPYISEILEGINVTVFAYGATGASNTLTEIVSPPTPRLLIASQGVTHSEHIHTTPISY